MKNVVTGAVLEKTWNPTEKVQEAQIETRNMTYSYTDGELYYFMDQDFNLTPLNYDQVEDALKYIKENDPVIVRSYKGNAFSVECENFVVLRVTQADPSVKGNTATNATKEAILETGVSIQVPMFVEEGELIRVDTRTGEYMERVKG
jgi:elongation factor P